MATLTIEPLPAARFGAEIVGLDPSHITAEDEAAIWAAYRQRHGLLCFSFDRLLDADELHGLTAVFGENEFAPGHIVGIGRGSTGDEPLSVDEQVARLRSRGTDPYLAFLGNVDPVTLEPRDVDTKFYGEWEWHTDMSYIEVPPTFSLLHARRIPDEGGDTGFCSQVMAAAELPDHLRQRVRDLDVKHDSTYASNGMLRPGMQVPASPIDAVGHAHPILRTVPTTGEEALFLGRRTNGYVVGLPVEESERLLDELWTHATQPRYCYRHRWRVGQVVVWDNRMLLHKRYPVEDTEVRFMWRTQTRGEPVVRA